MRLKRCFSSVATISWISARLVWSLAMRWLRSCVGEMRLVSNCGFCDGFTGVM